MAKNLSLLPKITASSSAQLAFMAGLSGLIYLLVFTLPFPLSQLYRTIPPLDYTKLTGYSAGGFIAYVAGLGVLFWLYVWAIRLTMPAGAPGRTPMNLPSVGEQGGAGEETISIRFIFIGGAVLAGVLVFSYPVTAIDLFIYAIHTRGWALYGLNPLAAAPETLPAADPWLGLAAEWGDAPSPYGPLWEWLSLSAFHLSGGDFLGHLFALKLIALLAYLGCAWLVYQLLRQLQPQWAVAGTIAFAWNPLVLLESVQNGHNDMVMIFFLLAAIWAVNGRMNEWANGFIRHSPIRYSLICVLLAISILVKFVTVLVVPFFLFTMTAHIAPRLKRLAWLAGYGFLLCLLVIWPILPLWPGWDNWAVLQAGNRAGRSLLALLILGFKDIWGVNFAFDFSRNLLIGLFGAIYLYYFWSMYIRSQKSVVSSQKFIPLPSHTPAPLLSSSFHILFWYVLLAAPVFHGWYLLWFLPLACLLLPQRRPLTAAIVFSITALFIIPYFETIRVWYPVLLQNQLFGHLIGVPLLLVPPALALLWPIRPSAESEV